MDALLVLHAVATMAMTGIIWFVQLVHYPLMGPGFSPEHIHAYHQQHMTRTTWVVAPLMLVECATGLYLALQGVAFMRCSMVILALIWLSTFLRQVPLHNTLAESYTTASHQDLVKSNWIRTLGWSARAALVGAAILA